jgi:hypothetical protein
MVPDLLNQKATRLEKPPDGQGGVFPVMGQIAVGERLEIALQPEGEHSRHFPPQQQAKRPVGQHPETQIVGNRNQEHAVRFQDTMDFIDHSLLGLDMLQHVDGYDHVEGTHRKRHLDGIGHTEMGSGLQVIHGIHDL